MKKSTFYVELDQHTLNVLAEKIHHGRASFRIHRYFNIHFVNFFLSKQYFIGVCSEDSDMEWCLFFYGFLNEEPFQFFSLLLKSVLENSYQ